MSLTTPICPRKTRKYSMGYQAVYCYPKGEGLCDRLVFFVYLVPQRVFVLFVDLPLFLE